MSPKASAKRVRNRSGLLNGGLALVLPLLAIGAATGCSTIKPKPIEDSKLIELGKAAREASRADVEPITSGVTLEEAIARALKYNLNQRARLIEQSLAVNLWKAGQFDMIPSAIAVGSGTRRNNELITRSRDSVTRAPSLANPSVSSDRAYTSAELGLSWSVIDFTLGYYSAKQNADRILIAAEHRRKAMHELTRDVIVAFWRMAGAQRLREDVRKTIDSAEAAIADSAKAGSEGLQAPIETLRFQRQLLENVRLLTNIDRDFAAARATLGNLINAPVGEEFMVVEPNVEANVKILDVPVERMEELALLKNADLREQIYDERIAAVEVRKTIAKMFPDLSFNYSLHASNDSYLINDQWNQAGLAISQNLGTLLSAPVRKRLADGGVELARQRRIAAQMALLAQVHIARLELAASFNMLRLSDRIWSIDQSIRSNMANRTEAQAESQLSRVATDTATIVSMLRRYQALAEFQSSAGALQSTLGMEISLDSLQRMSLPELTAAVSAWQTAWTEGRVPGAPEAPAEAVVADVAN